MNYNLRMLYRHALVANFELYSRYFSNMGNEMGVQIFHRHSKVAPQVMHSVTLLPIKLQ